jgi:hypothetical protein
MFNVQDGIQNYKPYFHLLGQMFDHSDIIIIHVCVLIHMYTNVILKKTIKQNSPLSIHFYQKLSNCKSLMYIPKLKL